MDHGDLENLLSKKEWLLEIPAEGGPDAAFAEVLGHVSNGYLGIRLTTDLDDPHSEPGFFAADVYDSGVGVSRELVNLPNPLGLRLWHGPEKLCECGPTTRLLDMKQGLSFLHRRLASTSGISVSMSTITLLHARLPTIGMTVGTLAADAGYRGPITLDHFWDNGVGNAYLGGTVSSLRKFHVAVDEVEREASTLVLRCHLAGTNEQLTLSSRVLCAFETNRYPFDERSRWGDTIVVTLESGAPCRFAILWTLSTGSHASQTSHILASCVDIGVNSLLSSHRAEWHRRWSMYEVRIDGDDRAQEAINFSIYNLLQSELPARDAAISPARGLSSSYHSGNTFFDTELHKDAYWAWTEPAIARSHLMFRFCHLDEARQFAVATGYAGARFPEASDDLGQDAGPHEVLAYPRQHPVTEWSVKQVIHISADVAYAVHRYHHVTRDEQFMRSAGIELALETARFAASALRWRTDLSAHGTTNVMGPDEYHSHVSNNYFTNYLLRWNIHYALTLVDSPAPLPREAIETVSARIGLTNEEIERWRTISDNVFVPPDLEGGVPAQHEGYDQLEDCPPRRDMPGPTARLFEDEAELAMNLQSFPTKVIKQGDIVLLIHLFPDLFARETQARAYAFYEPRTSHESSLSAAPHGVLAARLELLDEAYRFFLRASRYNLDYEPRGNYRNGLHFSAFAGAWQIIVEGLLDIRIESDGALAFRPRLPEGWQRLEIPLWFRDRRIIITVKHRQFTLECSEGPAFIARVAGREFRIETGQRAIVELR